LFGNTYSHRGLSSPDANTSTEKPLGARGIVPVGHATTFENFFAEGVENGGGNCAYADTKATASTAITAK
jgi:hypothetical protein